MSSFELCILTYSYAPVTHDVHDVNCNVTQHTVFSYYCTPFCFFYCI